MVAGRYKASKTRDKGREKYSVIFRHPVRVDPSTGKPGRRVRRGLGTDHEGEADRLVGQIDELLANEEYWSVTARASAEGRFDPVAVSAFFEGMEPASTRTSVALRDGLIQLPPKEEGYKRVLLLGTTGAGKTTVVRQLLGTDPETDRFPSTSTAKTTVADTEILVAEGSFRAAVTFFPRDEVIDHLVDCASKAAQAAFHGAPDEEVRRLLLDHEDQRFRFSYVLGRKRETIADGAGSQISDFDEDDEDTENPSGHFDAEPAGLAGIDLDVTSAAVDRAIATLRKLVGEHGAYARAQLAVDTSDDERIAQEIIGEELDKILRGDEPFHEVVDSLLEEIEKRFGALTSGSLARDQQGWPSTWYLEKTAAERVEFLRAVNRFSSNYAPLFGHLLSPLVDGIRVAGPFAAPWLAGDTLPKLILIDGEGLGHTPRSSSALPTSVAKAIEDVDAVLLVDNATQPIQAAPVSAVRSILTSGNIAKLIFCFTHFDEVKGDNLRSSNDRAQHVIASVENLLSLIRDEFGPRSERALRRRHEGARFFLGGIDKPLDAATTSGRQSIGQFKKLLATIKTIADRPETGPARPVYDKANLVLAITAAVTSFHRRWNGILGLTYEAGVEKEHWGRVKALNRRFAEGTADQYDTLRPASELRELLKEDVYKTLEVPLRWIGEKPTEDEAITEISNEFSQAITTRLFQPVRDVLSVRPQRSWQEAYSLGGRGSTFARARKISAEVFMRNVPVPGATPSPDQNTFLHAIIATIEDAAATVGVGLQ